MLVTVTVKLTEIEARLLDWLLKRRRLDSRSDVIRVSVLEACRAAGIREPEFAEVARQRREHPPKPRVRHVVLSDGGTPVAPCQTVEPRKRRRA